MVLEDRWLRETYVDLLIEYAAKNKDIVILEADLMKAGGTFRFAEKYPERTFDVGIQEANMIGTAAGMSAMGKIPFTHTFTAFATRRVCDQVTLSVAYARTDRKDDGKRPWCNSRVQRRNPHEHGRCFHYEKYSWNDCLRAS